MQGYPEQQDALDRARKRVRLADCAAFLILVLILWPIVYLTLVGMAG